MLVLVLALSICLPYRRGICMDRQSGLVQLLEGHPPVGYDYKHLFDLKALTCQKNKSIMGEDYVYRKTE